MIRLLDRHWLLTWTTYGTWLPGDRRGFVSGVPTTNGRYELHNIPGEPYDADMPDREAFSREQMHGDPIRLHQAQAQAVCEQFQETAAYRRWLLAAASVMSNHAHAVLSVPGDPDPSRLLGDLKAYASRKLTRNCGRPPAPRWWTQRGSKRKLRGERAVQAAVRYVLNQHGMLACYVDPDVPRDWRR